MPFRATKPSEYDRAKFKASDVKRISQIHRAAMAAGPVSGNVIRDLFLLMIDADVVFQQVAAVTGMAAYAQAQEGDAAYNVASEFTAMRNAVQAVRDRIISDMPKGTGPNATFVCNEEWTTTGINTRTFTTALTANLRTTLDTLIATID